MLTRSPTFSEKSGIFDGVFLPPVDAAHRLIFFAEVQFQKDPTLYDRFFAESHLYRFRNPETYDDWFGVLLLASRSLEPDNAFTHRSLLNGPQVQRIYLDELGDPEGQPVGISLMQLTLAPEPATVAQAKALIQRVQQEDIGTLSRNEIIEIITTIAVYKFANLSREDVEAMLGLKLEDSRIYQEAEAEGERKNKLKIVSKLFAKGLSVEEIAEIVELTVEEIRQIQPQ